MSVLSLSFLGRLADFAPLVARVIVGVIMVAHGWQKLVGGPAAFGEGTLAGLGVPLPIFMGFVVTFVELGGGLLLIVGFLSRFSALLLTVNMLVATLLVKVDLGLIAEEGAGAELDLALIASLVVVLLAGPGKLALDRIIGLDRAR